tara:strand:- start:3498 stop:5225 length:1728 start_codon:yes stop_codon:yes gene_type:complete
MSVTLGLNFNHADSSACLFVDGKLKFAVEEERINRIKHWAGVPVESIQLCLNEANLEFKDIANITVNTNPGSNINQKLIFFFKNYLLGKKKFEIFNRVKKKFILKDELSSSFNNLRSNKLKIHYIDHHISHISSAYYASNFNHAVGLSIDGFGDFCSLLVAECSEEKIKPIEKLYFPNSLGLIYEAFTQFIGFNKYGEEYKMMGLSSLGQPIYKDIIKKNLFTDYNNLKLNLKYFNHHNKNYLYNFSGEPNQSEIFNKEIYNLFKNDINTKTFKEDIASSIQNVFEDLLNLILLKCIKKKISKNLVYAGGCALNSLANKKIFEKGYFDKIYIPYAPGDGGGGIGSSLFFLSNKKKLIKENLNNPYLGKNYTNSHIEKIISQKKLIERYDVKFFENKKELFKEVAIMIMKNNVIGFFNGKMEFGARALGNRSILANPCSPNMKDIINMKIKRRENFRPFAPSILIDYKEKWFGNTIQNPYMSAVEDILPKMREYIPAVTHFDGTGRVQTVSKEYNLDFYNLIFEFFKISKIPILLNTSFNENEPIVMKPSEAIDCFERTKMDSLVLENYLVTRRKV